MCVRVCVEAHGGSGQVYGSVEVFGGGDDFSSSLCGGKRERTTSLVASGSLVCLVRADNGGRS